MDMNTIFSCTAKKLFDGTLVFDGMATKGDTTKQVLEKVQAMMTDAKDTCDGVIGMEDEFETFKNAKESAEYLLSLMAEGAFPQENTPYDSDWGRTFDSICGSCLNISFAYALLKGMGDNIVVTDDDTNSAAKAEEARKAAEAAKAEEARKAAEAAKAEEARKAAEAAKAEEARKAAEAAKAEEARKAEIARQAKAAAVAETEKSAAEAKAAKAETEASKKKPKKGFFQKAKDFLSGEGEDEDNESEQPKPLRRKKKSADILEDFVDE